MRIYVLTDMEGISGISASDFVMTDGRRYPLGCRYFTWDVNACVRGCFAGGATSVLVRDGHGAGQNILWDELDPRAELIQGTGHRQRLVGIEACDAVILLGYHAMAGHAAGILEHTFSSADVQNLWLNGQRVGEFAVDTAACGDYGKPVIMASGDDQLCAEARALLPDLTTCVVKHGLACQQAWLLSRPVAHQRLEEASSSAVRRALTGPPPQPYHLPHPVTIRVELVERRRTPNPVGRPGITLIDGRTFEFTAPTVEQALLAVF